MQTLTTRVAQFVRETFLLGDHDELENNTDLVELGAVDSVNVLQLVDFIEGEFDILLMPADLFRLVSVDGIVELIQERTGE